MVAASGESDEELKSVLISYSFKLNRCVGNSGYLQTYLLISVLVASKKDKEFS